MDTGCFLRDKRGPHILKVFRQSYHIQFNLTSQKKRLNCKYYAEICAFFPCLILWHWRSSSTWMLRLSTWGSPNPQSRFDSGGRLSKFTWKSCFQVKLTPLVTIFQPENHVWPCFSMRFVIIWFKKCDTRLRKPQTTVQNRKILGCEIGYFEGL